MTAGVSAVEAGAAEVSRGIVSTLTLYGLFVSVVGARYARGCSDMSSRSNAQPLNPNFLIDMTP
jgi:hypothetical protein